MIWAIMIQLIYYLSAKPFSDRLVKVTEITNELIMLLLVYVLPTFTDFIPNDVYKLANYRFGWLFLAILSPFFLFNFGITIVEVVAICLEKRRISRRLAFDKEQVQKRQKAKENEDKFSQAKQSIKKLTGDDAAD